MPRDPYKYFRVEAQELTEQLNRGTLELEKATTPELVARLLRLAHTLKGAARIVKRPDIGDLAHAIEDVLAPLREAERRATRPLIDAVLGHLDDIGGRLASLSAPAEPKPAAAPVVEESSRTARIDIEEMDALIDGLGEAHIQLGLLRERLHHAERLRDQLDFSGTRAAVEHAVAGYDELHRSLGAGIETIDRELRQARDATERMRLVPADSLFVALERTARDAAQVEGKQVVLDWHGGEVRLDAQVLAAVQGALLHAVRNAVAHGIEAPEERRAAGKPVQGRVTIGIAQRGGWIEFGCADDGRGIDLAAVRRIAEQRNLMPGVREPDAEALLRLLLKGGISTLEAITEMAGRGVGLDVVRDAAERLEGKAALRTEAGNGTALTLTVPLSIASVDGLRVESAGVVATLPIRAVRAALRLAPEAIARSAQGESVVHEGKVLPFLPLARALSAESTAARGKRAWSAVVVEAPGGMAAIGVERLLGAANVVLRPLPALAPASPVVAGVSLDVEGNPQLVLDPESLVAEARRAAAPETEAEEVHKTILVIDDSLTTRMLERSILESAGYAVDLAVSGEEAMDKAGRKRYALFLVDIEMPGMDGFTFIERTRMDLDLRDIPAILVTSRASSDDVRRGREAGAADYVVKSEFDQGALLARIGELIR